MAQQVWWNGCGLTIRNEGDSLEKQTVKANVCGKLDAE